MYFAETLYHSMKVGLIKMSECVVEMLSHTFMEDSHYVVLFWGFLLQGAGTDDHTLIRVMVTRSEVDMLDIRAEFRRLFACSLHSMIKVHRHTRTYTYTYTTPATQACLSFLMSVFMRVTGGHKQSLP